LIKDENGVLISNEGQMKTVFQKSFEPNHPLTTKYTRGAFKEEKYHYCNQNLPSCPNTSSWEGLRL